LHVNGASAELLKLLPESRDGKICRGYGAGLLDFAASGDAFVAASAAAASSITKVNTSAIVSRGGRLPGGNGVARASAFVAKAQGGGRYKWGRGRGASTAYSLSLSLSLSLFLSLSICCC
jgi:hypothetical protein